MKESSKKKQVVLKKWEESLNTRKKSLIKIRASLDEKATLLGDRERKLKKKEDIKSNKILKLLDAKIKEKTSKIEVLEKNFKRLKEWINDETERFLKIQILEDKALENTEKVKEKESRSKNVLNNVRKELKNINLSKNEALRVTENSRVSKKELDGSIENLTSLEVGLKKSIDVKKEELFSKTVNLREIKKELSINLKELKNKQTLANRAIKELEKAEVKRDKALNDIKKEKEALGLQKNKISQEVAALNRLKKAFRFYASRMNRWFKSKGLREPIKLIF